MSKYYCNSCAEEKDAKFDKEVLIRDNVKLASGKGSCFVSYGFCDKNHAVAIRHSFYPEWKQKYGD